MNKKIKRVQVRRVSKHEVMNLISKTVVVAEMHNPEELHIDVMLGRLKAIVPEIVSMDVAFGAYPETVDLIDLRVQLDNVVGGISFQARALSRSKLDVYSAEVELLVPVIKRYLKGTYKDTTDTLIDKSQKLILQIDSDVALTAAVAKVSLKVYLDQLDVLLKGYHAKQSKRLVTKKERPRYDTNETKVKVGKALSNFLDAVEVAKEEYQELDFEPLVINLNELYVKYKSVNKSVTTRNLNKSIAAKAAEAKIATDKTLTSDTVAE